MNELDRPAIPMLARCLRIHEVAMNWEHLEGRDWEALGASLRTRWPNLTAADLAGIGGKREDLVARIRALYGLTELRAQADLRDWERHQRPIETTWPAHDR